MIKRCVPREKLVCSVGKEENRSAYLSGNDVVPGRDEVNFSLPF